jgi:hypothetical protein
MLKEPGLGLGVPGGISRVGFSISSSPEAALASGWAWRERLTQHNPARTRQAARNAWEVNGDINGLNKRKMKLL